ncbi:hypothetical protein B0T26DRAFT_696953 [Lasiosphaeria miniovina]|uniref:Ribosomal protein L34 n=1 Tax=Lasiosphaeria miniovina TaxID=1954250 RepID=A0AA40E5S4_9PEZI|nr:uncharacterized protein B0T26DRAFT_696953 [Lasiosphaeria miniovina]KAK0728135.1 hypothetical protein B0T26DRAFT_696953 [Lasiosphaeria miniovina]
MPRLAISSPLLQAALQPARAQLVAVPRATRPIAVAVAARATRTFSHLPSLRPTTLLSSSFSSPVFRVTQTPLARLPPCYSSPSILQQTGTSASALADVVPKSSISAHPALAATQIRCGPRATMSGHSRLIQKRRHGFLSRIRTKKGRKLLARRRDKGRKRLSA